MTESKSEPRKVKVVDRRKFTADGEPRAEHAGAGSGSVPSAPPPTPEQERAHAPAAPRAVEPPDVLGGESSIPAPKAAPAGRRTPSQTSQEFLELVAMLAQNAEFLLLGAEDMPARPAEARRVIDWLAALEQKTAGNLSADEQKVLSDLVFQLRTAYVQRTG
ncbi:MAG TPA: DUF1844 domain-containing protein [Chondromyces sp.]|nr:DUF1844 domain-containing protein [Chondromyces sp.]